MGNFCATSVENTVLGIDVETAINCSTTFIVIFFFVAHGSGELPGAIPDVMQLFMRMGALNCSTLHTSFNPAKF